MQAIWIRIQMFLSYTEDRQIGLVGMATKPGPFYVASNVPWRLNPTQHPFLFCRFSQGQFCKFLKLSIRPPPYINITKTDHTIPHPQALKIFSNLSLSVSHYNCQSMATSCTPAILFKISILLLFMAVGVFSARTRTETMVVPKAETSKRIHVYARKDIPTSAPSHRTHSGAIYSRHLLRKNAAGRKRHARGLQSKPGHGGPGLGH